MKYKLFSNNYRKTGKVNTLFDIIVLVFIMSVFAGILSLIFYNKTDIPQNDGINEIMQNAQLCSLLDLPASEYESNNEINDLANAYIESNGTLDVFSLIYERNNSSVGDSEYE